MSVLPTLHDIGAVIMTKNNVIQDPGTGNTFNQNGMAYGTATVGAGTYKLPDDGLPMYVQATGAVTVTSAAAVTIVTLSSGQVGLFLPLTATTWACTVLATGNIVTTLTSTQGFIDLPLDGWREVASNDITNAAGNGGVLATDTTPTLEYVNGDTDSQIRVLWAGGNADPLARQISLPPDLDRTQPIVINLRGVMGGENDAPVMDIDTFFNEGDTKVEDATAAWDNSVSARTATIAAADIPAAAATMSVELTPGAHATDAMVLYSSYVTYTKKLLTS
jgi:hypothetical protein